MKPTKRKKQRRTFKSEFERGLEEGIIIGQEKIKRELRQLLDLQRTPVLPF